MKENIEKILYAEDEEDIRTIANFALSTEKWEIEICNSGIEILEKIDQFKPDLLLLDVMMPEMDGPTAFKKIKENPSTSSIPAIFMTAKVQAEEVQRYLDLGAIGVIRKPFDPMNLASEIKKIWIEHQEDHA